MTGESITEMKELKVEEIKALAEEKGCPVQKALYYITEFLSGPMCSRCFPCSFGSYEARMRLEKIANGRGEEADLRTLRRVAEDMLVSSMCKKGKDTARFIIDWMETDVFREHVDGICPAKDCTALIEYRVIPERCTSCGLCLDACSYHAILGEKSKPFLSGYVPFEIRQKRCMKCDACRKVCPTEAILIAGAKKKELAGV
ncbi:MAG TPA: NADH-ubiquinone oxidoreductase-F iron-sulfur binding region domain-containing protein [Thermodesulfovibrionales bacterium]|jgi:ferredoxin|nr:NADH-ubiquinone oxidoreductase-F iron-sulfur binding region domain-containing protein [Thermodesulfovibrionales bacterium]